MSTKNFDSPGLTLSEQAARGPLMWANITQCADRDGQRFQVCNHGMDESAARSGVPSIQRYVTPQAAADPVLTTHRAPLRCESRSCM